MTTLGDLLANLRADSPWLLFVAIALLSAAAAVGRRVMASMQRQGGRIGDLEKLTASEQTRRRQVEAELLELGISLPYWPEDPTGPRELAIMRRRLADAELGRGRDEERQDQAESPLTREASLPPVPHRRHTADRN